MTVILLIWISTMCCGEQVLRPRGATSSNTTDTHYEHACSTDRCVFNIIASVFAVFALLGILLGCSTYCDAKNNSEANGIGRV